MGWGGFAADERWSAKVWGKEHDHLRYLLLTHPLLVQTSVTPMKGSQVWLKVAQEFWNASRNGTLAALAFFVEVCSDRFEAAASESVGPWRPVGGPGVSGDNRNLAERPERSEGAPV